jgi:hypothetical protein
MNEILENQESRGAVEIIIDYDDGRQERRYRRNCVVRKAKEAHVLGLVNQIGASWDFYVDKMLFGTNGTLSGVPKVVEDTRNGLFGTTLLSKSVASLVNPQVSTQAIFTTVVSFSEGNGSTINEMALQMKSGDIYSMVTMPGIAKTSSMQITFNWRLSFV